MAFYNRTPNLLLLEHLKDSVFYFLCGGIGRKGAVKKRRRSQTLKFMRRVCIQRKWGFSFDRLWSCSYLWVLVPEDTPQNKL